MSSRSLEVYMDTVHAADLTYRDGRCILRYDADYDLVSVSMALSHRDALTYKDAAVKPYLQGLLPDNELTLLAWRKQFSIRAEHPFALLAEVGEECAGAVQFLAPELEPSSDGGFEPLGEADIESLIVGLKSDPSGAPSPGVASGQFSLAGAQSKFSLLKLGSGGWARSTGAYPSTHIVKPALGEPGNEFEGKELNEHVCMTLARRCGLPVPMSAFVRFGDEAAIVVTRYDRIPASSGDPDLYRRVHQEDLCQALGIMPDKKYTPTIAQIAGLLGRLPQGDREPVSQAFGRALMYNWLIAGTDAHAKNYSLLHAVSATRLAPLYDLISYLPYRASGPALGRRPGEGDRTRVKLPMALGGAWYAQEVTGKNWLAVEAVLGLEAESLLHYGSELGDRMLTELPGVLDALRSAGWSHDVLDQLEARMPDYVAGRRHALTQHRARRR